MLARTRDALALKHYARTLLLGPGWACRVRHCVHRSCKQIADALPMFNPGYDGPEFTRKRLKQWMRTNKYSVKDFKLKPSNGEEDAGSGCSVPN